MVLAWARCRSCWRGWAQGLSVRRYRLEACGGEGPSGLCRRQLWGRKSFTTCGWWRTNKLWRGSVAMLYLRCQHVRLYSGANYLSQMQGYNASELASADCLCLGATGAGAVLPETDEVVERKKFSWPPVLRSWPWVMDGRANLSQTAPATVRSFPSIVVRGIAQPLIMVALSCWRGMGWPRHVRLGFGGFSCCATLGGAVGTACWQLVVVREQVHSARIGESLSFSNRLTAHLRTAACCRSNGRAQQVLGLLPEACAQHF